MRNLTKNDVIWEWTENHERKSKNLKFTLSNRPILQRYNPQEQIILSVDSSKDGMGAVILQNQAPVTYASKPFTEIQQRYAQIKKETP